MRSLGKPSARSLIVDRTANLVGTLNDPVAIKARVDAVVLDGQLRTLLHGIVDRTVGNSQRISEEIAHWFDGAMDRVSGVYKRWSQWISFFVALVLAIILNISALHVTQGLFAQSVDTKMISQIKAEDIKEDLHNANKVLTELENLPNIGWKNRDEVKDFFENELWGAGKSWSDAWTRVLGWVITALGTLFGAAFWFDALQRIIRLKGSGPSPTEKSENKAAAA